MSYPGYPSIDCSRCDRKRSSRDKCDDFVGCEFDEYYDAMTRTFSQYPPMRYLFTITGGVNAGKTYYIIYLIYSLLHPDRTTKVRFEDMGIRSFEIVDPVSRRNFNKLLDDCKLGRLGFTRPTEPLSYFNIIIRRQEKAPVEVVFFNASGEKLENLVRSWNTRSEDPEMQGVSILHFVDPREDSKLNKLLKNPKNLKTSRCKNEKFIDYITSHLQHRTITQKIQYPLAVCLSKFDLLSEHIPHLLPVSIFTEINSMHFERDLDNSSMELQHFLDRESTTIDPLAITEDYEKFKYFAVAPYGKDLNPPIWEERAPRGIFPPFIWLLKSREII